MPEWADDDWEYKTPSSISPSASSVKLGAQVVGLDKAVGEVTVGSVKTTHYDIYKNMEGNHATRRAYIRAIRKSQRNVEIIPKGIKGSFAKYSSRVGIWGTITLGATIGFDYMDYNSHDAPWCVGIDFTAFMVGYGMVALIPVATPLVSVLAGVMIAGAVTTYATELAKNYYFPKQ